MRKGLLIGVALLFTVNATAVAATPATFADVPAKHWAYEAVAYLAKTGIVDGYGDQTFRGDKTISRYEMAQIVYKAMQKQNQANIAQKAVIDKLAAEFALEMTKIDKLETRMSAVEKDHIAFGGRLLTQWKGKHADNPSMAGATSTWNTAQIQYRIDGKARVDDNTSITLRLANPAPTADKFRDSTSNYYGTSDANEGYNAGMIDRFYATTKFGGINLSIGKIDMGIDPDEVIIDGGFFNYDGVKLNTKVDNKLNIDFKHGRFARNINDVYAWDNHVATDFKTINIDSLVMSSKAGNFNWALGYASFTNPGFTTKTTKADGSKVTDPAVTDHNLMEYYFGNLGYKFSDTWSARAEIGRNQHASTGGSFYSLIAVMGDQALNATGKNNFTVQYTRAQANAINSVYTSVDQPDEGNSAAWKDVDLAYRYAFSNNMTAKLQYGTITADDKKLSYHDWRMQMIYKF